MICPYCNATNSPSDQFCMNCGKPLGQDVPDSQPLVRTVKGLLGLLTLRLVLFLIFLWFIEGIVILLPFMTELRIPNFPISVSVIISTIVTVTIIGLLIGYSRTLWVLWNQSFPRYGNFGVVLVIGVYLIVLVLIYRAVLPWLTAFMNAREPAIILQIVMGIIALVMVVYILVVVYRRLPEWLAKIRQDLFAMPSVDQVACLNCGHLNGNSQAFCGHCGASLTKPSF